VKQVGAAIFSTGRAGSELLKVGKTRPWLDIRAGVVFSKEKEGQEFGELCGEPPLGIAATLDYDAVVARPDIQVVLYGGLGSGPEIAEYARRAVSAGKDFITVAGFFHAPTALGPDGARALDEAAKRGGGRAVGTGLYPGFLFDVFPIVMVSNAVSFEELRCERVADCTPWGDGVLRMMHIGEPPEAAAAELAEADGGLLESAGTVSDSLGLAITGTSHRNEVITTDRLRESPRWRAEPGMIVGYHRRVQADLSDGSRLVFDWRGQFGLDPSKDGAEASVRVVVEGNPPYDTTMRGPLFRDTYPPTAARALAAVRPLHDLPPGLYRIDQVPVTPAWV
jgi:4-hydroxy-tetrahydrodipicolinate reductase